MNCEQTKALLSAFIDDELNDEELQAVQKHLDSCFTCKKEMQELKTLKEVLSSIGDVPIPPEFDDRLHTALKTEAKKLKNIKEEIDTSKILPLKKNKFKNWKRISSIAAVFMVGLFSIVLYNNNLDNFNQQDLQSVKQQSSNVVSTPQALSDTRQANPIQNEETVNQNISQNLTKTAEPPKTYSAENLKESVAEESVASTESAVSYESVAPAQILKSMPNNQSNDNAPTVTEELENYFKQLEKIFADIDYTIDSYTLDDNTGIWNINVTITTVGETGNEIKENAIYCGQDGKVWKKEP